MNDVKIKDIIKLSELMLILEDVIESEIDIERKNKLKDTYIHFMFIMKKDGDINIMNDELMRILGEQETKEDII